MIKQHKLTLESLELGDEIFYDSKYLEFQGFLTNFKGSITSGLFFDNRYNIVILSLSDIEYYMAEENQEIIDNYRDYPQTYDKPEGFTDEELGV